MEDPARASKLCYFTLRSLRTSSEAELRCYEDQNPCEAESVSLRTVLEEVEKMKPSSNT